jgi:hypothetical protein
MTNPVPDYIGTSAISALIAFGSSSSAIIKVEKAEQGENGKHRFTVITNPNITQRFWHIICQIFNSNSAQLGKIIKENLDAIRNDITRSTEFGMSLKEKSATQLENIKAAFTKLAQNHMTLAETKKYTGRLSTSPSLDSPAATTLTEPVRPATKFVEYSSICPFSPHIEKFKSEHKEFIQANNTTVKHWRGLHNDPESLQVALQLLPRYAKRDQFQTDFSFLQDMVTSQQTFHLSPFLQLPSIQEEMA